MTARMPPKGFPALKLNVGIKYKVDCNSKPFGTIKVLGLITTIVYSIPNGVSTITYVRTHAQRFFTQRRATD